MDKQNGVRMRAQKDKYNMTQKDKYYDSIYRRYLQKR